MDLLCYKAGDFRNVRRRAGSEFEGAEMAGGDYVHGQMDIKEHEGTFALVWALTKWGTILSILLLAFLAFTRTNAPHCDDAAYRLQSPNACEKVVPAEGASGG